MHPIDYGVIPAYFAVVIGIGMTYRRLAARSSEKADEDLRIDVQRKKMG